MIGVEKEVSEAASKTDLMRRALYNCLAACSQRNDELAEAHWGEFKAILRELNTLSEDTGRKRTQLKTGIYDTE